MKKQDEQSNNTWLINVRLLAALDTSFHGVKLIVTEFLVAVLLCLAVAVFLLFFTPKHTFMSMLLGLYSLGVALNYVPLLYFALLIGTRDRAIREIEQEMGDPARYVHRYSLQSILFILVPFALAILAFYQFIAHRTTS